MKKNCDTKDRLNNEKIVYGKKMLTSHRNYKLWNEENHTFNVENINTLYEMFIYNMIVATKCFETRWVDPKDLITTSKRLIWDWTDNKEKLDTAEDILNNGVYFPIFTLDKGKLHNQILKEEEMKELASKNLYNSYNGNHRIDVMHYWQEKGEWDKDVLIYIIPDFCEKSCTGFKYTPIDDQDESNKLKSYRMPNSLKMIHLNRVEHEMKYTNWKKEEIVKPGISIVEVDNYNAAFRIMTEFQNVLEQPLVHYYKKYRELPDYVLRHSKFFNDEYIFYSIIEGIL